MRTLKEAFAFMDGNPVEVLMELAAKGDTDSRISLVDPFPVTPGLKAEDASLVFWEHTINGKI